MAKVAADELKATNDAEVVKNDAANDEANTNCKPPEADCINEATIAAEAALAPLTEAVEKAQKDLMTAESVETAAKTASETAVADKTAADEALALAEENTAQLDAQKVTDTEDFRNKAMNALLCTGCTGAESDAADLLATEANEVLKATMALVDAAAVELETGIAAAETADL